MNSKAIGIFDSGIGGLTVYKAIKEIMPDEKVVYLGDTARLPYGTKSRDTIIKFSRDNAAFLMEHKVKIIVVACNSASSYAVAELREQYPEIPVLGVIEPGAEAAVKWSRKRIGVIGTTATVSSNAYKNAILELKADAHIISKDCPLFVPLVEEGWVQHPVTRMVIQEYLLPLKEKGIDSLVLGCTHYPVLKGPITGVLGEEIRLIDSAETISRKVNSILKSLGWQRTANGAGDKNDLFFVTDFPERFKKVGEIFLERKIDKVETALV